MTISIQGQVENLRSGMADAPVPSFAVSADGNSVMMAVRGGAAPMMVAAFCSGDLLAEMLVEAGQRVSVSWEGMPRGQQVIRVACRKPDRSVEEQAVTHLVYLVVGDIQKYRHDATGEPLVDAVGNLLEKWDLPGAVLADCREGGDTFSHAIGWADAAADVPMAATNRFRAASLGKVITTVCIYRLIERGLLDVEQPVSEILEIGTEYGESFRDVTVRHLLRMSAGVRVDSAVGAPPTMDARSMREHVDLSVPVGPEQLDSVLETADRLFDPGEKFDYHTDNYWLLGRIIERLSGQSYADFVIGNVFRPLGLNDICLATSLPDGRHPDEVIYHEGDCPPEEPQAAMGVSGMVPAPYQRVMPIRDAMGGWLVTAGEMVTLNRHLMDLAPSLVQRESLETMLGRVGAAPMPTEWYYGDGLFVQNAAGRGLSEDLVWWHFGLVPGCSGLLARIRGRHIALLVNGAPVKQNIFLASLWRVILKTAGK